LKTLSSQKDGASLKRCRLTRKAKKRGKMSNCSSHKKEKSPQGFASLEKVKVRSIGQKENSAEIEFFIPETSSYFDGHFPEFSLLPAVAQTELVIRFASEYLGTGIDVFEMKRIKFTKFIRPNAALVLQLEKSGKSVGFKIFSPAEESVYSSGTIFFGMGNET
jgi:3-hydroxymyristoyl/3-hydroxydecanoyl-(acyl carrier protein) dehydratase